MSSSSSGKREKAAWNSHAAVCVRPHPARPAAKKTGNPFRGKPYLHGVRHRRGEESGFIPGFRHQCHQVAEYHRRCDAARRTGDAPGENAQQPLFLYRFLHTLGQGLTEAGQGDRGAGAGELHDGLI